MTPKEKAEELIERFENGLTIKDCALIAVDEILEITKRPKYNPFDWNEITGFHYDKYWQEVKQELENGQTLDTK